MDNLNFISSFSTPFVSDISCNMQISQGIVVSEGFSMSMLQLASLKLRKDNYGYYRAQVLYIIVMHDLKDHLLGLIPCPSTFIIL